MHYLGHAGLTIGSTVFANLLELPDDYADRHLAASTIIATKSLLCEVSRTGSAARSHNPGVVRFSIDVGKTALAAVGDAGLAKRPSA